MDYDTDARMFAEMISGLGESYGRETPKPLIRAYWDALKGFTLQQIGLVVEAHIRAGLGWPEPIDLITQIRRANPPTDDRHKARSACNRAFALRCASASERPGILQYEIGYDGQFPVNEFTATVPLPKSVSLKDHQAAWSRLWHDFDLVFAEPEMWDHIRSIGGEDGKTEEHRPTAIHQPNGGPGYGNAGAAGMQEAVP